MSSESPASVLYDGYYGNPLDVQNASPIPANTAAILTAGSDGTNARYMTVKAPSTAAVAADPALVVTMSPNNAVTITDADTTATGALGALNAAVTIVMAGEMGSGMQLVAGSLIGTIVAEVSTDGGTTWAPTFFDDPSTSNIVSSITFSVANTAITRSIVGAGGASSVRVRVSAYTSGTATCNMRASFTHDPSVLFAGQPGGTVQPPTADQIAGWDGTTLRVPAVKAPSTAAAAVDQALVVSLSPNSPVNATLDSAYFPNPANITGPSTDSINVDPSGNLAIRGAITTDEIGFRDSFLGTTITTALTGTLTFVNGSTMVTGTGTSFTTQIVEQQYIKLTADSETAYAQVSYVVSNTSLVLISGYTGTSTTGASVVSNWATSTGSGGTIAVSSSNLNITNGTGSGTSTHIQRFIDYAPLQMYIVTNYTYGTGTGQVAYFGFQDNPASPGAQAIVQIDASLATNQIRFISALSSAAAETVNQIFTLPYGLLNTQTLQYKITTTQTSSTLEVSQPNTNISALVCTVTTHLPYPYTNMYAVAGITNSAAVTASGVLSTDVIYVNNQDRIETALSFTGEPITVIQASDLQPSTQTITAQDTGSTSTAFPDGQTFVTGTATTNSYVQYNTISAETIKVQVTGTWTGTLSVEKSMDGGTTWVPGSLHVVGTQIFANNFTTNFMAGMNCSGTAFVRVRATTAWTGTATVKVVITTNENIVYVGNAQADQMLSDSYPNPKAYTSGSDIPTVDFYGNLETRGPVLTDEGSFRDDFSGSSLTTALTGTLNFTNGSTTITGVGTTFTTQIKQMQYIKQSSDPEADYVQVSQVISNTQLLLVSGYAGTTTSGASAVVSNWITQTGTGGSISVSGSILTIASGTTVAAATQVRSLGDYGPYSGSFYCQVSQRIANQTGYIGFQDTSGTRLAMIQFTGTNNTQALFVTSYSAAEIQATTVTLPNSGTTATYHLYKIDISATQVTCLIDGVVVGINKLHIPGPYDLLFSVIGFNNSSPAPASSTTIQADYFTYEDLDRLQMYSSFPGEPIPEMLTDGTNGPVAVKAPSTAAVATDPALVVTLSPNSAGHIKGTIQPLYGANNQSITITMTGGNGVARASTAISNTTTLYEDVILFFSVTIGGTGTVLTTGYFNFYGYASANGGSTYPEGITGTDAAVTLTSPPNLVLLAQMNVNALSKTFTYGPVSFCRTYGMDRLPPIWGVVAVNQTGGTTVPTAGSIIYQGINGQII